jgi:hypothetical protein
MQIIVGSKNNYVNLYQCKVRFQSDIQKKKRSLVSNEIVQSQFLQLKTANILQSRF